MYGPSNDEWKHFFAGCTIVTGITFYGVYRFGYYRGINQGIKLGKAMSKRYKTEI